MDSQNCFFTVILTTFNRKKYLIECIESVIGQTFSDFELIVIDDKSDYDINLEVAPLFNDYRIKWVVKSENTGQSNSRNICIEKANSKYIAFIDDDDLWLPNHLEKMKHLIDKYPEGVLYHSGVIVYSERLKINIKTKIPNELSRPIQLFKANYLTTSSVVIKRSHLGNKRFNESLINAEDYLLWLQIAGFVPVYGNTSATIIYKILDGFSLTQQKLEFITKQRLKLIPLLDEYYANKEIYKNKYRFYFISGIYCKIARDNLNEFQINIAIFYLIELIKKYNNAIFNPIFLFTLMRVIKLVTIKYLWIKN